MNQGTQGYSLMKKTEGQKSLETVPLRISFTAYIFFVNYNFDGFLKKDFCKKSIFGGFQTPSSWWNMGLKNNILWRHGIREKICRKSGNIITIIVLPALVLS
jgi:hypothetical protein